MGRKKLPVDPDLLTTLRRTYDQKQVATLPLTGIPRADVDALVRELRRAQYRHFPSFSVKHRRTASTLTFWLDDKAPRGHRRPH